jgi:cytochrome c oxidase subunit I
MAAPDDSFFPADAVTLKRAWRWLFVGVAALGIAGLFAALLANTKNPYFYTALVVHVNLSELAITGMFSTLAAQGRGWGMGQDAAFMSFTGGAALIALSGLTGGAPYMNNYVPVIHHPLFFLGLGLIASGSLIAAFNLLAARSGGESAEHAGVVAAAFILIMAFACFVLSAWKLPSSLEGEGYYEYLFWGGGHVLQFVYAELVMVAWFWLAREAGLDVGLNDGLRRALYTLGLIAACGGILIYFFYDPASDEFRNGFTLLMRHGNGLAPLVAGASIVWALVVPAKAGTSSELHGIPASAGMTLPKIVLIMSLLLFGAGGVLGYIIGGNTVTVPAHYHGSIVGITLAFMGVAYAMLPRLGYGSVGGSRLAFWQPVIYGGGQLLWMMGMAILGAHGVPRKTPGSADTMGQLAALLKHNGDGLALIGGLLFVFVVLRAVLKKETS